MKVISEPLPGLKVIQPQVFGDHRGYFLESYHAEKFKLLGINDHFVQDNRSFSAYGTLRGLHYQIGEYAQSKLVSVNLGEVIDVVVDLRPDSETFKKSFSIILSEENKLMMYIPRGFAHGFAVLSPQAQFIYKCDNFYSPANEGGIIYKDAELQIDWKIPLDRMLISPKDLLLPTLKEHEVK
jgi:dTDP-4-dehydrorhamnose 3,5-epimerase